MAKNIRIIPASGSIYFVPDEVTDTNAIQFQLSDTSNNVKIVDGATNKVFAFFDKTNFRTEFSQSINLFSTSSNPPASVGGLYYNTTDGNIYRSNGSGWSSAAGTSGTSGTSGSSGTSGNSGTSGSSGTSGISGTSGTSGTSGNSGTSGTSGSNGTSGTSVSVSGTNNSLAKFTSATTIGNSIIFADTTKVQISGGEDDCFQISSVQPFPSITATGASNTAGLKILPTAGFDAAVGNYNGGNLNLVANSLKVGQVLKSGSNYDIQVGEGLGSSINSFTVYASNAGDGYAGRITGKNSNGWMYFQHRDNSATYNDIGYVNQTGISAIAFFETSDIRFKDIIETNPKIDLTGIDVIKFTRTDIDNNQIRYGYSAQQVQEILPDVVTGKDKLVVNYSDVHTLKIAALEKHIAELEAKLNK